MVKVLNLYHNKHAKRENFLWGVYVEDKYDVVYNLPCGLP